MSRGSLVLASLLPSMAGAALLVASVLAFLSHIDPGKMMFLLLGVMSALLGTVLTASPVMAWVMGPPGAPRPKAKDSPKKADAASGDDSPADDEADGMVAADDDGMVVADDDGVEMSGDDMLNDMKKGAKRKRASDEDEVGTDEALDALDGDLATGSSEISAVVDDSDHSVDGSSTSASMDIVDDDSIDFMSADEEPEDKPKKKKR